MGMIELYWRWVNRPIHKMKIIYVLEYWVIQFDYLLDYIDLVFERIIVYKSICQDITYFILICLHIMCLNCSRNTMNNFPCSIKFAQMFAGQKRKPGAIQGQK